MHSNFTFMTAEEVPRTKLNFVPSAYVFSRKPIFFLNELRLLPKVKDTASVLL